MRVLGVDSIRAAGINSIPTPFSEARPKLKLAAIFVDSHLLRRSIESAASLIQRLDDALKNLAPHPRAFALSQRLVQFQRPCSSVDS